MGLLDYAQTDTQKRYAEALDRIGSENAVAREFGVDRDKVRSSLRSVKRRRDAAAREARKGYSPKQGLVIGAPEGYEMPKATVQYNNRTGEIERIWPRYSPDQQYLRESAQAYFDTLPKIPDQKYKQKDFCTDTIPWYQIGDGHLGMLARESEVGENFDLETAEQELMVAMATLIDSMDPTERCVINDLGDMSHFENSKYETERGGHPLDNSCTYAQMMRVRRRIMRFIIERAQKKAKYVDVIINQGNHSRTADWAMADLLTCVYEKSKRVTILNNDSIFIPYRMGNTFVMTTHTDKIKPAHAAGVMAEFFQHDWGEAKYKYLDGGHVHHTQYEKEINGVLYRSWNNLAPNDKYAHEKGYGNNQCISVIERSRTYGKGRETPLGIDRVRDIINNAKPGTEAKKRRKVYTV